MEPVITTTHVFIFFLLILFFPEAISVSAESAQGHANIGAPKQLIKSHACSSAKSAVSNASVFLLGLMLTRSLAPATTTGKQREEDPNALELITLPPIFSLLIF
uniref:Uncharacterized protein n=1 Tax=Ananas comosus var. bracteatus TaxID=296719 RepID=A0A6V7NTS1_ANACO|nr:unnamed protein product [Ananas comosus var. bracteatus]